MRYSRNDQEPSDVDDEAAVGLMTDKSASPPRRMIEQRHLWISKYSLTVALVSTNIAWAGLCSLLLLRLHLPHTPPEMSQQRYEADFGTSTFIDGPK